MEPSYMTSPRSPATSTPLHMFLSVDAKNLYQESAKDDSWSNFSSQNVGHSSSSSSDMGCPRTPESLLLSMFNSTQGRNTGQKCRHASSPYHKRVGKYLKKMKWRKKRNSEPNGDTVEESQEKMEASYMRSPRSSQSSLLSMFNLADVVDQAKRWSNLPAGPVANEVILSNLSSPNFGPKVDASYTRSSRSPARFILSMFSSEDGSNVHHKCAYASNPYHKCDETCIANEGKNHSKGSKPVVNEGRTEQSGMSTPKFSASWLLSMFNSPDGNNVQKKCDNAQMREAGNKGGSKGLKSAAIHDSRDIGDIPKSPRNVHPQCKYIDSPYHNRCTQTCMQRIKEGYKQSKEAPVDEKLAQSSYQEFSSSPHRNLEDPLVKSTPGASWIGINTSDSNQRCTETNGTIEKQWEEDQSVVIEYDKWIAKMKRSSGPGLTENFSLESPEMRIDGQHDPLLPFTKLVATDEENVNLKEEKSVIEEAEGEATSSGQSELQPKFVDDESDCDKCIEEEGSESFGKSTNNDQNKGSDPLSLHAHLLLSIIC